MSVGKIAFGVFLGNLATALLSLLIIAVWTESQRSQSVLDKVNADYNTMIERQGNANAK